MRRLTKTGHRVKRFFRILRGAAAAVSSILCTAMVILLVRSHLRIGDNLLWFSGNADRHTRTWIYLTSQNSAISAGYLGMRYDDASGYARTAFVYSSAEVQPGLSYRKLPDAPAPRSGSFWNRPWKRLTNPKRASWSRTETNGRGACFALDYGRCIMRIS